MAVQDKTGVPMSELIRLEGRRAVVTGGAMGIGRAIAERFLEAGAVVVITDVDAEAVAATAAELSQKWPERVSWREHDVSDGARTAELAEAFVAELGGIDVWVNNAGVFPGIDPVTTGQEEFERVLKINLSGTYIGIQAAARHMAAAGGGVIINLASTLSFYGAGAYPATKWAVRGMTRGLAPLLGPQGIRVVALAPGLIDTPGTRTMRAEAEPTDYVGPIADRFDYLLENVPLRRPGVPDDVARAALFLASDAASFITGVTLLIDGGEVTIS
jgi:NAD(P)-dependent dehydrogenase (short-subunit alcohol dehydrogenase family)